MGPADPSDGDGVHRWRTSARLRAHVRDIWAWRQDAGPARTHQGVPGSHLTVVICLEGDVEILRAPDPTRGTGRFVSSVAGLHDSPAVIATGPPQTGLELGLTWRGARTLLGLPARELVGDVVDLTLLLPELDTIVDRLRANPTWRGRFALLDAELCRILDTRDQLSGPAPQVGWAWDELVRTGGTVRISDLAADLGWSRRHLGARLRAETGLGTKTAARLIRFERARSLLGSPERPAPADVAAVCGYADQPHLARDFRDLAGITATQWLSERPERTRTPGPDPQGSSWYE